MGERLQRNGRCVARSGRRPACCGTTCCPPITEAPRCEFVPIVVADGDCGIRQLCPQLGRHRAISVSMAIQGFERYRAFGLLDSRLPTPFAIERDLTFYAVVEFCAIPAGDGDWTAYRIFPQSYLRGTARYRNESPFGVTGERREGEVNGEDALGIGNLPLTDGAASQQWGAVFAPRLPVSRNLIWSGADLLPDVCWDGGPCGRVTGPVAVGTAAASAMTYRPSVECSRDIDPRPGFDDSRTEASAIQWASACGRGTYLLQVQRDRVVRVPRTADTTFSYTVQTSATWTYTPTCPCDTGGDGGPVNRPTDPRAAAAFDMAIARATGLRPDCPGCGQ